MDIKKTLSQEYNNDFLSRRMEVVSNIIEETTHHSENQSACQVKKIDRVIEYAKDEDTICNSSLIETIARYANFYELAVDNLFWVNLAPRSYADDHEILIFMRLIAALAQEALRREHLAVACSLSEKQITLCEKYHKNRISYFERAASRRSESTPPFNSDDLQKDQVDSFCNEMQKMSKQGGVVISEVERLEQLMMGLHFC